MFVSIYYKPSLFNAHTMSLIVHIFMKVNKLCLNEQAYTHNVQRDGKFYKTTTTTKQQQHIDMVSRITMQMTHHL